MKKSEKKDKKVVVETISKEVKKIIRQLKKSEISCFSIPEEYRNDKNIIDIECKLGMRKVGRRGYDVIRNTFFVEEELTNDTRTKKEITYFDDFESYSAFLDDEIYDDACYYQCDSSKIRSGIDQDRLFEKKCFVEDTIDNYTATSTAEEISLYRKAEKLKKLIKKWIDKFYSCSTADELRRVVQNYSKSKLSTELAGDSWYLARCYRDFFMWQYIFSALDDKKRFNILMEYMSDYTCAGSLVREVCTVFDPDEVMAAYNYTDSSKQGVYNQKKRLKDIAAAIKEGLVDKNIYAYFDEVSHYYCEECRYTLQEEKTWRSEGMRIFSSYRYFESFEEFIKYRKGDLTCCDLTKAIHLEYDFSECKMDETTKLPIENINSLNYFVKKVYSDGKFKVSQEWYNSNNVSVKKYEHEFDYFFDFVAFLNGDLSEADLLLCEGLQNLNDVSEINFENVKTTSDICDKFGLQYEIYKVDDSRICSFPITEDNEKDTALVLQASREVAASEDLDSWKVLKMRQEVYYVSDIHLLHKLKDLEPKSKSDVAYVIKSIVDNIVSESGDVIIIGGDVSSDFSIYELFIKMLRSELDRSRHNPLVVFTLGNHELWEFPQNTFDEIVKRYDDLISGCGMYLLQNNIIYQDSERVVHKITPEEILSLEDKALREKVRTSRITFFGGLAFSGYNENFNAYAGIYRNTIDRATEIKESKTFEELYKKVCSVFSDRNMIVFTHMPMVDWGEKVDYLRNFIYVSGHTHRNYFYDDGDTRVYADNQIGYANNQTHMKWFAIENDYDYFADYPDGIYEITGHEYQEFYRGKNIRLNFNREVNILYLLKKNGYYCFIHESAGGSLTMLNGGALKKLEEDDINYYYENMDSVVSFIKKPLDEYTKIQEKISNEIQKIGGSGYIHGCIIDIDFYNHVYVNPVDMKITGYWASDIIHKKVYPTVPALLKEECPALYAKYTKLLKENSKNLPTLKKYGNKDLALMPQSYLDTDIYKVSREIKKMQKLSSNILTAWYGINNTNKRIELKSNKQR